LTSLFGGLILFVVQQYPHGWGVQVIILACPLRPKKSPEEADGHQQAATDQEINNAHDSLLFLAATWVAMLVNDMIVAVLSGIKIAAVNGAR
jgi:hypothetical protein